MGSFGVDFVTDRSSSETGPPRLSHPEADPCDLLVFGSVDSRSVAVRAAYARDAAR